jgi:hypothetical protein
MLQLKKRLFNWPAWGRFCLLEANLQLGSGPAKTAQQQL